MGRLISESEIRDAVAQGRIAVPHGAIVTPAARDLARHLGVALERESDTAHASGVVALGADHGGYDLKESLKPFVSQLGFTIEDVGCHSTESVDYPMFAARVAELVADRQARFGIMVDGAGIGSAMVANKVPGVRAALCYDLTTAGNAREHNNANVLTLGGTLVGDRLAREIVERFLTTPFAGGRHDRRVAMIDALDGTRAP
ncbi:MAG: ribose 5-phosphate isomerase B [Gemmatimonadales bacterium]